MSPSAQLLINAAIGFVIQLVLLAGIPWLVYVIRYRKLRGFLEWIGLKAAPAKVLALAVGLALVLAAIKLPFAWGVLHAPGTVSGELLAFQQEHGWTAGLIATLLLTAWLNPALTEEIFFRGFLANRLVSWLGFGTGNVVQALIFGAIHLPILFVVPRDFVPQGAVLVLGATISGWIMGYLNCRMADGSILPSWCMHGLGNTLAYALPLVAG